MSRDQEWQIHQGVHEQYYWLTTEDCLSDLLQVSPNVVVGKYLAVTSFDSGPLYLSEEEKTSGWESRGGIAYSPRITSAEGLPHGESYDEWYVFNDAPDLGKLYPMTLNPFEYPPGQGEVLAVVNYHMLLHASKNRTVADLFWNQMNWIAPLTYLADCQTHLTIVSKDQSLIECARNALSRLKS